MMMEAQTIAERLGVEIGITLEQREGAEKVSLTRPQCCKILKQAVRPRSMPLLGLLQNWEGGRISQLLILMIYASVKLLERDSKSAPRRRALLFSFENDVVH